MRADNIVSAPYVWVLTSMGTRVCVYHMDTQNHHSVILFQNCDRVEDKYSKMREGANLHSKIGDFYH